METKKSGTGAGELDALLQKIVSPGIGSAAVLMVSIDGELVMRKALGTTRMWDAPGRPTTEPAYPVTLDTRFDLASITKAYASAAILTELEQHGLDPSLPVAEVLPEFRTNELRGLSVMHLLTHTSGFQPSWLDHRADPGAVRFRANARPVAPYGGENVYSCLNLIWGGLLGAELSGLPLDALVTRHVLDPLRLTNTGYLPAAEDRSRIAATEFQPERGLVQGEVHDETAFALGGVSGNAGIFGSAPELLRFAEALRTGEVFSPRVREWLMTPVEGAAAAAELGYRPTMGLRSDDAWTAAALSRAVGHTGFTGTAFYTEPEGSWSLVLLTNRVHPTREQTALPEMRTDVVRAAVSELA